MRRMVERKVPGGKLLRVRVDFDEHIRALRITGDFMVHPEEALFEIERNLSGIPLPVGESDLRKRIQEVVDDREARLVGFSPGDLASVISEALE